MELDNGLPKPAEKEMHYGWHRGKKLPLGDLLPLDTPTTMMIDTTNVCNFKCVYCPTGNGDLLQSVGRPKGFMKPDLFRKIIDDLKGFSRQLRVLHLFKDSEPLANRQLPEMISYAKQAGVSRAVEITSNGSLLTPEWAEVLIDSGLDGMRISIHGISDETYKANTVAFAHFSKIVENVRMLFETKQRKRPSFHLHCKTIDTGLTDEQRAAFTRTFATISDSWHIDAIMGWSSTQDKDMTLGLVILRQEFLAKAHSREIVAFAQNFL